MELSDFIAKSLIEILNGVEDAASRHKGIAPASIEGKAIWTERHVEFEIGVEVDASAKGGIRVFGLAEADAVSSRTASHNLKFSVPVHMNVKRE